MGQAVVLCGLSLSKTKTPDKKRLSVPLNRIVCGRLPLRRPGGPFQAVAVVLRTHKQGGYRGLAVRRLDPKDELVIPGEKLYRLLELPGPEPRQAFFLNDLAAVQFHCPHAGKTQPEAPLSRAIYLHGSGCLYDANIFASVFDVVPPDARGRAAGFMNMIGWLAGGGSAPLAIGLVAERSSLGIAMALTSLVYVAAGALLMAGMAGLTRGVRLQPENRGVRLQPDREDS